MPDGDQTTPQIPIAIIGMDCLFPSASGLHEYWRLIRRSEDAITDVPETHWKISDYYAENPGSRDLINCRRGGFLSPIVFDPVEWGIPPTVVEATDTAQLLGLVVAKRALADAGYDDRREFDRRRAGVILGVTGTQELTLPLAARLGHPLWRKALRAAGVAPDVAEDVVKRIADGYVAWQENSFPGLLGNVVAGRIANRLDLRGTNCVVDAACASSLSAVHLAALELSSGRTDVVLAGGVDTLNDIFMFMCFSKAQALSPTGDARPFSKDADGTVIGEGVGVLVLKRLEDAERDGDRVYAVLRGMGTSSDGRSQSIYAPHAVGQARALRAAYEISGVGPATIELVEAHGTGTKVGDVVEVEALKTVYREARREGKWCALGSVKSQIGHTKAAAGAASLIKTVLALHHRALPATIKVDEPNPKLGLDGSPFYLSTETRPWLSRGEHPRRAAVSAFGFGGSNFHAVLEEHPTSEREVAWDGSVQIIGLAARTPADLEAQLDEWSAAAAKALAPDELTCRAARSRAQFRPDGTYRLVLVIEHGADLAKLLANARTTLKQRGITEPWHLPNVFFGPPGRPGKLALLFPGQGSQYVGMGRDIVCQFPEAFDAVAEADRESEGLADRIYPQPTFDDEKRRADEEVLKRTEVTQPALGAVSLALLRVLQRFGLQPDFAAGHSFGELVALRAAGRMGDGALRKLAGLRGRLMGETQEPPSAMLAVEAPLEEIDNLLADEGDDVVLANRNSPRQGILSGARAAVEKAAKLCDRRGWRTKMLQVSAAFHSKFMAPVQERFRAALEDIKFELGRFPVLANVTGGPYPADAAGVRELLARQLTNPVQFVEQIKNLYEAGARTFVEVGPKAVLTGLVRSILHGNPLQVVALDRSLGRGNGVVDMARVLALLAVLGYTIDLQAWERPAPEVAEPRLPIPLLGCNYRSPARTASVAHTRAVTVDQDVGKADMSILENEARKPAATETPRAPQRIPSERPAPQAPSTAPVDANGDPLAQVLNVVQEGLRSMQALQQQTAAAHQRFLETQEQAHRSFQAVMESQQRLMEQLLGGAPAPAGSGAAAARSVPAERGPSPQLVAAPPPEPAVSAPAEPPVATAEGAATPREERGDGLDDLQQVVLEAVAELTGYPIEMLDVDMDMEADLGIDSIKRLEILGAVQRRTPQMQEADSQYMGSLRTLRNIIDYVHGALGDAPVTPDQPADPTSLPSEPATPPEPAVAERSPAAKLVRRVLTTVELPPVRQRPLRIASGYEVWVTDDGTPLAPTLVRRLRELGQTARVIAPRPEWKNAAEEKIGGLIFLGSPTTDDEATWTPDAEQELKCAFTRVKQLAANLREAADRGGALLATVARLDGAFGLRGTSFNALQGGLSGLAKTAAHEWPTVRCRALDVSANWQEVDAVADALACELSADGPLEVGLDDGQRVGLETTVSPAAPGSLLLEDGDVVVISGGARGVTADAALALARARRLTLVLLGRSPAPTSEPDWLVGLSEEAAIKRALLAHGFDKRERPSPAELEAEYRRAMANREIGQNLERLRATGSTAVYHSVDVRDAEAVAELLAELRREYGPVRGLIHGAGVIADRHIADKTPDQFDRVFDTKVAGLRALLGATAEDELKCLALFSSASARFGRQGQVDYAMANEVLNKVAHQQAALRPGCRVVAINWGPWDGGMVTRALKSEFAREGIELIPREAGARCLVEELSTRDRTQIEVLIGASFPRPQAETPAPKRRAIENVPGGAHLAIAFERELEVQTHPFLRSHVLNGHPVLPVAMILEWLSHGALHDNPGLVLHGFDDFRVLKGVVLDSGPKTVCVCAAPAERYSDLFHVRVELRSGQPGEHELAHARATVLLATRWPAPPKFELPADLTAQPYAPGLEAVYRDILFHGPHFQSIRRITGISARGMVAEVRPAPPPSEWMSEPLRSSWLSDPVVVDGGLQLGVLWCHQELGAVALPSYGARYRQYQPFPPADVTTVLEVRETGPQLMAADLTFLDSAGQVIAQMQRAEWTVDASLRDAFVQNALVGV